MFNQNNPKDAINRYVGEVYIQHDPTVGDGKEEAFIEYLERMVKEYPDKHVYFKRIIAEENYVVLHCYQGRHGDSSSNWAGINIFRLDDKGKKEYPPSNVELALFKNIPYLWIVYILISIAR